MKENSKKKNKWYFWFYFRKGKCPQNKPWSHTCSLWVVHAHASSIRVAGFQAKDF
jgi:hypothetical protein